MDDSPDTRRSVEERRSPCLIDVGASEICSDAVELRRWSNVVAGGSSGAGASISWPSSAAPSTLPLPADLMLVGTSCAALSPSSAASAAASLSPLAFAGCLASSSAPAARQPSDGSGVRAPGSAPEQAPSAASAAWGPTRTMSRKRTCRSVSSSSWMKVRAGRHDPLSWLRNGVGRMSWKAFWLLLALSPQACSTSLPRPAPGRLTV
mmetsp:Transcript_80319/g.236269  ORF Transcript_80319/g.236269 Transcript_80319/m.236269 type:complete len:207 (+) Transcript_80319:510-1130(+)